MRLLLLALVAVLVLPTAAQAAKLESGSRYTGDLTVSLWYTTAPGETAQLSIVGGPTTVTFRDAANPIEVADIDDHCTKQPDDSVRCDVTAGPFYAAASKFFVKPELQLGRGDDVVDVSGVAPRGEGVFWDVEAREGDDSITSSVAGRLRVFGREGTDTLRGGEGIDDLDGGDGNDRLDGGGGEDRLVGGLGDDRIDGGAGRDRVSYDARSEPVTVDLADFDPDGAAGEADVLTSIEDVTGGSGADRLAGDGGPNDLRACEYGCELGGDRLEGRGGADVLRGVTYVPLQSFAQSPVTLLDGGLDDDFLVGGPGPDQLAGGQGADLLACGGELDRVLDHGPTDTIALDCDRVDAQGLTLGLTARKGGGLHLSLPRGCGGAARLLRTGSTTTRRFAGGRRRTRVVLAAPSPIRGGAVRVVYSRCGKGARRPAIRFRLLL